MSPKRSDSNVPQIMVFRPSWEEFSNFSKFIEHIESKGAHKAGVVKVIHAFISNEQKTFIFISYLHE